MDRASRNELLKEIDRQQEQIKKYEKKLRDVVLAYKSLVKEKEALEKSIQALSSKPVTAPSPLDHETQDETESFDDPLRSQVDSNKATQQQLATVTASLATLTEEKNRLTLNFQSERKLLKQRHEERVTELEKEVQKCQSQVEQLEKENQEWKQRVRTQQHERETEQNDHALMLRELQILLAKERNEREQVENELEESNQKLLNRQVNPDLSHQYEQKIQSLQQELEKVRNRLKASEDRASQPSPLLLRIQEEMNEVQSAHRMAVQMERKRANDVEIQLKQTAEAGEERVSALESKLSELSNIVGNYEKLRYQDQASIQRLRERVTQLDLENSTLAKAARSGLHQDNSADDDKLDVKALLDQIIQLKSRIEAANAQADKPINITELFVNSGLADIDGEGIHKSCKEEIASVQEEFERYKLRAQSVLKNKKDVTPSKELEDLKNQNAELRDKIRSLVYEAGKVEEKNAKKDEDHHQAIKTLEARQKYNVQEMTALHKQKLSDLQHEMRRHRDRTIALLAEKDAEIESLRGASSRMTSHQSSPLRFSPSRSSQDNNDEVLENKIPQKLDELAVQELLSQTSISGSQQGDMSLLLFAQEQARRDVEMTALRKQKHDLELALRDLQHSVSLSQENSAEKMEGLNEEIRRLERGRSRESANLEYLKNVVYQYMVCGDSAGKHRMLNAISTILQFSPKEKEMVQGMLEAGWWTSSSSSYAKPR